MLYDHSHSSHQICGQRSPCAGSSALWQMCSSVWPNLNQREVALHRKKDPDVTFSKIVTIGATYFGTVTQWQCASESGAKSDSWLYTEVAGGTQVWKPVKAPPLIMTVYSCTNMCIPPSNTRCSTSVFPVSDRQKCNNILSQHMSTCVPIGMSA